jgi:hypothetical protein
MGLSCDRLTTQAGCRCESRLQASMLAYRVALPTQVPRLVPLGV